MKRIKGIVGISVTEAEELVGKYREAERVLSEQAAQKEAERIEALISNFEKNISENQYALARQLATELSKLDTTRDWFREVEHAEKEHIRSKAVRGRLVLLTEDGTTYPVDAAVSCRFDGRSYLGAKLPDGKILYSPALGAPDNEHNELYNILRFV